MWDVLASIWDGIKAAAIITAIALALIGLALSLIFVGAFLAWAVAGLLGGGGL